MQNGQVSGLNAHCATQRPQIRRRSAFGVITANSGSQPQNGQCPWVQDGSSVCMSASAQRARNGRNASTST